MNYICPICNKELSDDVVMFLAHGEEHIIDKIKKKHPEWIKDKGVCHKCYAYYKENLRGK